MRTYSLSLGVALTVVAFGACTDEDGDYFPRGGAPSGSRVVRFSPTCGSPGDTVDIRVGYKTENGSDATCSGSDQFTAFFSPSVESKPTSVGFASGEDCELTTVVPAGAATGKIRLTRTHPNFTGVINHESDAVFTIPCPPDAGDPDSSTAQPPFSGIVSVIARGEGAATTLSADFRAAPANDAETQTHRFFDFVRLEPLSPLGIAVGTCGTPVPPGPDPGSAVPTTISVGELSVRGGGAPVLTLQPQVNGGQTFYRGDLPVTTFDVFDLFVAGGNGVAAATFTGAVQLPPADFSILSPDRSSGALTVPSGDLTFTYPALTNPAARLALKLTATRAGASSTCVLPPGAGTFTVPAATLGTGTVSATLRFGYVAEVTQDQRRYLFTSNTPINFDITVQ